MDAGAIVDALRDNADAIGVVVGIVSCTIAAVWVAYKIKHDRDERDRKDNESQGKVRSALKRMHEELSDASRDIEAGKGIHTYEDPSGQTVSFLKVRFFHTDCEDLIRSPEVRGTSLDVNEIKEAIGIMKEYNRIFDRMEQDLPVANEDGSGPLVEDGKFQGMLEDGRKMRRYAERLRESIPPILRKIEDECGRLG